MLGSFVWHNLQYSNSSFSVTFSKVRYILQSLPYHIYCLKYTPQIPAFIFISYPFMILAHLPVTASPFPRDHFRKLFLVLWFMLSVPLALSFRPFLGPPPSRFCVRSISIQALHSQSTTITSTGTVKFIIVPSLSRSNHLVVLIRVQSSSPTIQTLDSSRKLALLAY